MQEKYKQYLEEFEGKTKGQLLAIAKSNDYDSDAQMAARDILLKKFGASYYLEHPEQLSQTNPPIQVDNYLGKIIKAASIILLILEILATLVVFFNVGVWIGILTGLVTFISFLGFYALGDICCLLAEIRDNTKHLRTGSYR